MKRATQEEYQAKRIQEILGKIITANEGRTGIEAALSNLFMAEDLMFDYPLKNNNFHKGCLCSALETITIFISDHLEELREEITQKP